MLVALEGLRERHTKPTSRNFKKLTIQCAVFFANDKSLTNIKKTNR